MANSFDLSVNVRNANPSANIDFYYGTYNSIADALIGVPKAVRMKGKTVGILNRSGAVVEYWWKAGVEDADLVEKFGNSSVSDKHFYASFTHPQGESLTILKATHKMGDNPLVECFLNGVVAEYKITNSNGNITIYWGANTFTDNDVLGVTIVSSDYMQEFGEGATLEVLKSSAECGDNPFVQCYWKGELIFAEVENTNGNLEISVGSGVVITDNDKLKVILSKSVYKSAAFTDEGGECEYIVEKSSHGKGDTPIVQCWLDNNLDKDFVITNTDGDITVTWSSGKVSAEHPLVVLVAEEAPTSYNFDDLKDVAWTGLYDDLLEKPVFVATYNNPNGRDRISIPATLHKCGKNVMVQCKVNNEISLIDTYVNGAGDVNIVWSRSVLISRESPLNICIFGVSADATNMDEPMVLVTLNLRNRDTSGLIATMVQSFVANTTITLESFDDWSFYASKYELNDWFAVLGTQDVELTTTVLGKEYELNYELDVTYTPSQTTEVVNGTLGNRRYGVPVSLDGVVFENPITHVNEIVYEWDNPSGVGTLDGEIYIMNDGYYNNVTLIGLVNASEV